MKSLIFMFFLGVFQAVECELNREKISDEIKAIKRKFFLKGCDDADKTSTLKSVLSTSTFANKLDVIVFTENSLVTFSECYKKLQIQSKDILSQDDNLQILDLSKMFKFSQTIFQYYKFNFSKFNSSSEDILTLSYLKVKTSKQNNREKFIVEDRNIPVQLLCHKNASVSLRRGFSFGYYCQDLSNLVSEKSFDEWTKLILLSNSFESARSVIIYSVGALTGCMALFCVCCILCRILGPKDGRGSFIRVRRGSNLSSTKTKEVEI